MSATLTNPAISSDLNGSGLTVRDLLDRLGPMPLWRIRTTPSPGTATEQDVQELQRQGEPLCELVDGILLEKPLVFRESLIAATLIRWLGEHLDATRRGVVTGEQGAVRLTTGNIRIPDVAVYLWGRFPGGVLATSPIPDLVPDLAVEILSDSNTREEMARKRADYFAAGTRLVWEINPRARTVAVFTAPDAVTVLHDGDTLDGGPVLSDFSLAVASLSNTPTPA